MATFRYRAATVGGSMRTGALEVSSAAEATARIRSQGLIPIDVSEAAGEAAAARRLKINARTRQGLANAIGELAVLLGAGLSLDRALAVCTENIGESGLKAAFEALQLQIKEGQPLSRAMAEADRLFPPMASAMTEAGESDGRLDIALARLAETLNRAEELRQTVQSAMVYPTLLLVVALGVVLAMLLLVVPQFESLFADADAALPFMTRVVVGASHGLKAYGLLAVLILGLGAAAMNQQLRRPAARAAFDRVILRLPKIGAFVANAETARFARVLSGLVDGGVPLPTALAIAQKSMANTHMSAAIGDVGARLKQGGGLTGPLAATGVLPKLAISFLRTGEETARLGMMLGRLADVLDRQVRVTIERFISVLTPAITVGLGVIVATTIASIMSAILSFNDLALTQ